MANCTNPVLPPVEFDDCAPEVRFGRIDEVFITRATTADVLTDAASLTEWNTRINQTSTIPGTGAAPIRRLTVIGSLPAPEQTETEISMGRKVYGTPKNTLPCRIDELSLENLAMNREFQTAGTVTVKMWFVSGGLLFGGDDGIDATIKTNLGIPESNTEVSVINVLLSWDGVQPEAIASPFG